MNENNTFDRMNMLLHLTHNICLLISQPSSKIHAMSVLWVLFSALILLVGQQKSTCPVKHLLHSSPNVPLRKPR